MRTINDKILAIHTDNVPDWNYRSALVYLFYLHISSLYGRGAWVPSVNIILRFTEVENIVVEELNLPFHDLIFRGIWKALLE